MNIVGICMVKNEEDIIEMTLRHFLAEGLDNILVANNLSTDSTPEILERLQREFSDRLHVIEDDEEAYYQESKMNRWIAKVRKDFNADWIVPFDADEIWQSTMGQKSLKSILDVATTYDVVSCPVYDMIPLIDTDTNEPWKDIIWRNPIPELYPVVAFRWHPNVWLHQGNHFVDHPGVRMGGEIEVCHFQYRSLSQYKRKLRNGRQVYAITDLDYGIGQHWRDGGAKSDQELERDWINYCNQPGLIMKPCVPKGLK